MKTTMKTKNKNLKINIMKTKIYKTSTVLIIVLANLLISSSIFAQVKTITKKATLNTNTTKAKSNEKIIMKQRITSPTKYVVGDYAQGGIVFFVDKTGEHGLVCAKTDQSAGLCWSLGIHIESGANEDGLYQGMKNTNAIVQLQGQNHYAARICYDLEITEGDITYSDWYLPSKDELNLMSQNYAMINTTATTNGGSALTQAIYWSSCEEGGAYAWGQFCHSGNQISLIKSTVTCVRAVRAF